MTSSELMSFIINMVNLCSLRFSASMSDDLYEYHGTASNLRLSHKEHVILIQRRNSRQYSALHLPKEVKVFESQLHEYAVRLCVTDCDFKSRFNSGDLSVDDIETMVRKVTYGKVALHLRGRRFYEEDQEDY